MSRDRDPDQRKWKSLGYGGRRAPTTTWRYWKKAGVKGVWTIFAPNNLDEFEQHGRTVFYEGRLIFAASTQWEATWKALAYFYSEVLPKLPAPSISLA